MKRIAPQGVVDAYIATGYYPCQALFMDGSGGACALSAIAKSIQPSFCPMTCDVSEFTELLGITFEYFWGFIGGFDGNVRDPNAIGELASGHDDGLAAQRAVTAHFAKAPAEQPQEEPAAC